MFKMFQSAHEENFQEILSDAAEDDLDQSTSSSSGARDIRSDLHGKIQRMKELVPDDDLDFGMSPIGSPRDVSILETRGKYMELKRRLEESSNRTRGILDESTPDLLTGDVDVDALLETFRLEREEREKASGSFAHQENHPKFVEMYQQIVERDHKILDLESKVMELDRQVADLQDTVVQRDKVIGSKNEAVSVVQNKYKKQIDEKEEEIQKIEKTLFEMEKNFASSKEIWKAEKERFNRELEEKENKLKSFENSRNNFESLKFELNTKIGELQEKLVLDEIERKDLEEEKEGDKLKIQELTEAVEKSNTLAMKLKAQFQAKLKAFKEKLQNTTQLENQVVELEQKLDSNLLQYQEDLKDLKVKANFEFDEEINILKEKVSSLENELDGKNQEMDNLKEKNKEELESNLLQYSHDLELIYAQLSEKSEENEAFSVVQNNYIKQIDEKGEEIQKIEKTLFEMENNFSSSMEIWKGEKERLNRELEEMENNQMLFDDSRNNFESLIFELNTKIGELQEKLVLDENERKELKEEKEGDKLKIEELTEAIEANEGDKLKIQELTEAVEKSNTFAMKLKAQFQAKLKAYKEKLQNTTQLESQVVELEQKLESNLSQYQVDIKMKTEFDEEINVLKEKISSLENELGGKSQEMENLKEQNKQELENNFIQYSDDLDLLYAQLAEKSEENEAVQDKYKKQIAEKEEEIQKIEKTLFEMENNFVNSKEIWKEEKEQFNRGLEEKENKLQSFEVSKNNFESLIFELNSKILELQEKLVLYEFERKDFVEEKERDKLKIEDLTVTVGKSNTLAMKLKEQLEAFKENLQNTTQSENQVAELEQKLESNLLQYQEDLKDLKVKAKFEFDEEINILKEKVSSQENELYGKSQEIENLKEKNKEEVESNFLQYSDDLDLLYAQLAEKSEEIQKIENKLFEMENNFASSKEIWKGEEERFNRELIEKENKLKSFEDSKNNFASSKEIWKGEEERFNRELVEKENKLKSFEDSKNNFDSLKFELNTKIAELQEKLVLDESERKELKEEKAGDKLKIEELTDAIEKSNTLAMELRAQLETFKEKLQNTTQLESQVFELEQKLDSNFSQYQDDFKDLKEKTKFEFDEEINALKEKIGSLENELEGKSQEIKAYKFKIEELTDSIEKANTLALNTKNEELENIKDQNKLEFNEELNTLREKISLLENEIEEKSQEMEVLKEMNKQEVESNFLQYSDDLDLLYAQLAEKSEENEKNIQLAREVQYKLNEVSNELEYLKESYAKREMEKQIQLQNTNIMQLEGGCDQHQRIISELEERVKKLQKSLDEKSEKMPEGEEASKMIKEIKELKVKNGKIVQKFKQLKMTHEALVKANAELKNSKSFSLEGALEDEILSQVKEKEKIIEEKDQKIIEMLTEKERMSSRLEIIEKANDKLLEIKEEQDRSLENLERDKKRLESDIAALKWKIEEMESIRSEGDDGAGSGRGGLFASPPSEIEVENNSLKKHNFLLSQELLALQDEIEHFNSLGVGETGVSGGGDNKQEIVQNNEQAIIFKNVFSEVQNSGIPFDISTQISLLQQQLRMEQEEKISLENKIDLLQGKISEIEISEIKCFEESIMLKSWTRQLELDNIKYQNQLEQIYRTSGGGDGGELGSMKMKILQEEVFRLIESLQNRDKRCEELTSEITRLLEERDTLQLKLSNVLKHNVSLNEEINRGQDSPSTNEIPTYDRDELKKKFSELEHINFSINIDLRREREARRIVQEQLFFSQSSRSYRDKSVFVGPPSPQLRSTPTPPPPHNSPSTPTRNYTPVPDQNLTAQSSQSSQISQPRSDTPTQIPFGPNATPTSSPQKALEII